eukprot:352421-Chlamydomonas_euryale.AAC.82
MQFLAKNAASRATSRSSVLTRARGTQRVGAAVAAGNEGLWLPAVQRPEWLDGSLPGDRGFDPLGLSRPNELVQIGAAWGVAVVGRAVQRLRPRGPRHRSLETDATAATARCLADLTAVAQA